MKSKVTIIPDSKGKPLYVLMKYDEYQASRQTPAPTKRGKVSKPPLNKEAAPTPKSKAGNLSEEVLAQIRKGKVTAISAWREHLGLSKSEMARRVGVTPTSYAITEKSSNPRAGTIAKVAKALGISVAKLTGE